MSSKIKTIIIALIFIVILIIPLPADDELLRIHIKEGPSEGYGLFYATSEIPEPCNDTFIEGESGHEDGEITFDLDASLEGDVSLVRIDFPLSDELIAIDGIYASGAGIVRKRWSVSKLFDEENLAFVHDMTVQPIPSKEIAYIAVTGEDPFVVFNEDVSRNLTGHFSHKLLTRICVLGLIALGIVFYRKRMFGEKNSDEAPDNN